ncbi:hypothetical protein Tco_1040576 [Tanacetum coccineum]
MRMVGKGFSGRETPLFPTIMVQAQQEQGEGSEMPTDLYHTPTIIQPSTSQPQLKQRSRRPKRKDTKVPQPSGPTDNVANEAVYEDMGGILERAATTATSLDAEYDRGNINKTQSKATLHEPSSLRTSSGVNTPRSDEDKLKLNELMEFCTKLQQKVLALKNTKTAQAQEITSLKLRVKKLEKKRRSRTHKLKRLYKVGRSARLISSNEASLGNQEDASKQGRKIDDINKDAEITLVHETQGRYGDEEMFDIVTLAQALAALKSAKVQEKGDVIKEPSTTTTTTTISSHQDKGKGKMVEPEKPMKKKELIRLDEEIASKLQAEFDEEVRLAREKAEIEKEVNIVSWDNVQAMIDADYQMAQQMQVEE